MNPQLTRICLSAFLVYLAPGILHAQEVDAYRQGILHRALGHTELAMNYFVTALNQDQSDLARMALLEMRMQRDGPGGDVQDLLDGASNEYRPALYRRAGFLLMEMDARQAGLEILLAYADRFPEDNAADDLLFFGGQDARKIGQAYVSATLFYELLDRYPESELADDAMIFLARHYFLPGPDRNPDRTRDILLHFAADRRVAFRQSPYLAGVEAYMAGRLDLKDLFSSLYFPAL
jgi:tetratricopeptide (TPR) repeat protein